MTGQVPVDHHFTPVFYLSAWARQDGRVTRYSRPRDKVVAKSCAPTRTGSAPHLYTLRGVPPERQAALETEFFKPVDTQAATAHRLLLREGAGALSADQRVEWARFLLSMNLRSPFSLGEVEKLATATVQANLDVDDPAYEAIKKPDDPPTLYGWTEKYEPQVLANAHKTFLPGLIDHEGLGRLLINMTWSVVDVSHAPHALLTCDRPFSWSHGWKDPRAVLAFPLGPQTVFLATHGPSRRDAVIARGANAIARAVNTEVVRLAVDFVVGRDASQLVFVERRLRRLDQQPIPGPAAQSRS